MIQLKLENNLSFSLQNNVTSNRKLLSNLTTLKISKIIILQIFIIQISIKITKKNLSGNHQNSTCLKIKPVSILIIQNNLLNIIKKKEITELKMKLINLILISLTIGFIVIPEFINSENASNSEYLQVVKVL